jgi:hypothetical protein
LGDGWERKQFNQRHIQDKHCWTSTYRAGVRECRRRQCRS